MREESYCFSKDSTLHSQLRSPYSQMNNAMYASTGLPYDSGGASGLRIGNTLLQCSDGGDAKAQEEPMDMDSTWLSTMHCF